MNNRHLRHINAKFFTEIEESLKISCGAMGEQFIYRNLSQKHSNADALIGLSVKTSVNFSSAVSHLQFLLLSSPASITINFHLCSCSYMIVMCHLFGIYWFIHTSILSTRHKLMCKAHVRIT